MNCKWLYLSHLLKEPKYLFTVHFRGGTVQKMTLQSIFQICQRSTAQTRWICKRTWKITVIGKVWVIRLETQMIQESVSDCKKSSVVIFEKVWKILWDIKYNLISPPKMDALFAFRSINWLWLQGTGAVMEEAKILLKQLRRYFPSVASLAAASWSKC